MYFRLSIRQLGRVALPVLYTIQYAIHQTEQWTDEVMDEEHWTGVCSIESDFSAFITQFAGLICLLLKLSAFSIFF